MGVFAHADRRRMIYLVTTRSWNQLMVRVPEAAGCRAMREIRHGPSKGDQVVTAGSLHRPGPKVPIAPGPTVTRQPASESPRPANASPSPARPPGSVEETGLSLALIADLALKVIYFNDHLSAGAISDHICLRYGNIIEHALTLLRREHLVEATPSNATGELGYQYSITDKGLDRVRQVLERSTYAGPAPVTLEHYTAVTKAQAISANRVNPARVREAMADLVLEERVVHAIGRAVNTGRSLFLFGPPGNGKTVLAEHTIPLLGGHVLIPHAITVDGQIIKVFDLHNHQPVPQSADGTEYDKRFLLCRRPAIVVGGELTLDVLDLVYDSGAKIYQAPLQVKANGGMFLIDDFGRQLVQPRQLLNRWIVPLEKRLDYLTLHTGMKIEIPFDQLIVCSTNLAPKDLVDEAFLRRVQNKIHVGDPTLEGFCEIFRRQCQDLGVQFREDGLEYLLREYYIGPGREFRACHPRDLLRTMLGMSRYDGTPPVLSPELIDLACETYFVDL
jgi:hypothetical protein